MVAHVIEFTRSVTRWLLLVLLNEMNPLVVVVLSNER